METTDTLAMIEKHPLTLQLRAEEATALQQARQAAAATVEGLMAEADTILPELQKIIDDLGEELALHDAKRAVLGNKISLAVAELYAGRLRISSEIATAQMTLNSTCDARIDEAIEFFRETRETLLHKSPDHDQRTGALNLRTMTRELASWSNAPSIRSALEYCLESLTALEAMKLEVGLDAQRLEAIKANIPNPDIMVGYTDTKPLPKVNTDPFSHFKSDSQRDWEIGKLFERCKKAIGK